MAKKTLPENIQYIVRGCATFSGATCVVHAKDRTEALLKANAGDHIGGIDTACAELADWKFTAAEPDTDDGN